MSIVQTSDFIGQYKLPKDCFDDLIGYIAKYEKVYLIRLLGSDLYDLFIADLTGPTPQVPQTARFLDIFNPINEEDSGGTITCSEGILKMLVQLIYFHALRDLQYQNTASGTRITDSQSSDKLGYNGYNLVEAYNEGIENARMIQLYIRDNDTTYPEENMQLMLSTAGI